MYEDDESFEPIHDDAKIWRFMDFARFCSMLEVKTLYFSKPIYFNDPWEGFYSKKHLDDLELSKDLKDFADFAENKFQQTIKHQFGVNCWHINEHESEAFWRNYSVKCIAIQSTFSRLKRVLMENKEEIHIGKVKYLEEVDLHSYESDLFKPILSKRKSFEYENELRAVLYWAGGPFSKDKGFHIEVDLNILVENIYTTSFEKDDWFNKVVEDVIHKYGFSFPCIKSKLMDPPD